MLTHKQLDSLAKYRGVQYNVKMKAVSMANAMSWSKKLAKKLPANNFRHRLSTGHRSYAEWSEFGGNGKLAVAFMEAVKKEGSQW